MTYTYVIMEVSKRTFDEIKSKLEAAGYEHAINERGHNGHPVLDMHGLAIGVIVEEAPKAVEIPELPAFHWRCQFCGLDSPKEWKDDRCPKCGAKYDPQLAQDSEE